MARPTKYKEHLIKRRNKTILIYDGEGYNGEEIAIMTGVSRSVINRLLKKAK